MKCIVGIQEIGTPPTLNPLASISLQETQLTSSSELSSGAQPFVWGHAKRLSSEAPSLHLSKPDKNAWAVLLFQDASYTSKCHLPLTCYKTELTEPFGDILKSDFNVCYQGIWFLAFVQFVPCCWDVKYSLHGGTGLLQCIVWIPAHEAKISIQFLSILIISFVTRMVPVKDGCWKLITSYHDWGV